MSEAHWIKRFYYRPSTDEYDCEMFVCSECRHEFSYDAETGVSAADWNFCPACGAKIRSVVREV